MAYGTVALDTLQSSTAGVPTQFNDGNGTQVGTLCRAWVNFNGTGTVAIRASFNVSSITDNGTGDYTVNFTTALSDTNYSAVVSAGAQANSTLTNTIATISVASSSTARITVFNTSNSGIDRDGVQVAFFR